MKSIYKDFTFPNFLLLIDDSCSKSTYRILKFLCSITILFLSFPGISKATHINGADMSYRWISGNTFELKLTLYRDCSGIAAPVSVSANYRSTSCGYNLNVTLNRISGTGQEITYMCDSASSTCTGGTNPGIQKYEYTGIVTLPAQCADWIFGYSICCRNCAITTLSYSPNNCTGVPATYIEATLNNLNYPDNSSPVFTNGPVSFFCIGQPFHYNHGAYDPDGDSLVYSFIPPRSSSTNNVVFNSGYSATNPISSSPPLSLSPNGDITINPTAVEVGVMTMLIREYRNGILIGSVSRDMEMWTHACSNTLPSVTGINGTSNFDITACPGTPLNFYVNSIDADAAQILSLTSSNPIPGATFTSTPSARPVGNFSWTPTAAHVRNLPYTFTVTVRDNNCPSNGFQTYAYNITVKTITASIASTNSSCANPGNGTATVTCNDTGPFQYQWSQGGTTQTITGLSAGSYSVIVTDVSGCTASATTLITAPAAMNVTSSSINPSCNGASNGSISVVPSGGAAPYSYSWFPSGGTSPTASGLAAGTYTVTITDANYCIRTSSVSLTQPPAVTAIATGSMVSCHDDANGTVSVNASGGTPPYGYAWWNGSTANSINGLAAGNYSVVVTDSKGCTDSKTAIVTHPSAIIPTVTSTPATCGYANGGATVNISGGVAPYNYTWATGATTTSISGLAAGSYSITVTDANGCVKSRAFTVSNIASPSVNLLSKTDVFCSGTSTGSASVTVAGGLGPFTYSWSPGNNTTATATGLAAGTYAVLVTDASGCTSATTIEINEPSTLQASTVFQNPRCNLSADGSVTVLASGGTTPYSYSWNPGGINSSTASSLTAGTYTVVVTDSKNCTASASVTLTQPPAVTGSIVSSTSPTCFGNSNGSAEVTASGGSIPYRYNWFPNGDSAAVVSGLSAGNYLVTISDANNCTTQVPIIISEPLQLASSINSYSNVLCNSDSSGFAIATVTGGNPPYSYLWSPYGSVNSTITNLSAGQYTVTITDANSCTTSSSITLTQPATLSGTIQSLSDVKCKGGNSGTAIVSVSGGSAPYNYLWSTGATGNSVNNLPAGTHTVRIKDANNCIVILSVTINEPDQLVSAISSADVTCFGQSDGSATLNVSGGTTPYSYQWSPSSQNTFMASGLNAGNYSVTVTDANGCSDTKSISINQPSQIVLSSSFVSSKCNNPNGSATVVASGGIPSYTYLWSGGNTTSTISGIPAGNYSVVVSDSTGCTASTIVAVSNNNAPTINLSSITPVSCNGGNNGSATVTLTGPTNGFTYQWSPSGGTGLTATGLSAGAYTITVSNNHNCFSVLNVNIIQPTPLTANTSSASVRCHNGSDGSITVLPSGGTGSYSYTWMSSTVTSNTLHSIPAGNYTSVITDQNGCTTSVTGSVSEPPPFQATVLNSIPATCYGWNDGSATVSVTGGKAPFTYNWMPGNIQSATLTAIAGNYTVTVTDSDGCTTNTAAIISQPAQLNVLMNVTGGTCNDANGKITANAGGGTQPYSYFWNQLNDTSSVITSLSPGNYSVSVTDLNGCTSTASATVGNSGMMSLSILSKSDASCYGDTDGIATIEVTGGTAPFQFDWHGVSGNNPVASGLAAGNYLVTVSDADNCSQTIPVSIQEPAALAASLITTDLLCADDGNGTAMLNVSGGTGQYTYNWQPGGSNSSLVSGLSGGNYTVEVNDIKGCRFTTSFQIHEPPPLRVTTSSTPAGCMLSNGSASAIASGGTPPYSYLWNPGGVTDNIYSGIPSGSYSVLVTDSNNCMSDGIASVQNTIGPFISLSASEYVTCYGDSDGTAAVSVSGGVGPYTYNWFPYGGNFAIANHLAAGIYSATVRDSNNCISSVQVQINGPDKISAAINTTPVTCYGGHDGTATVTPSGGMAPYTFNWSTGDTMATVSGLTYGNHTLSITDAAGCDETFTVFVNASSTISMNIISRPSKCFGSNDGYAVILPTGGTPPYSYAWSNGESSSSLSNLFAGTYSITVSDATGCSADTSITISQPAAIALHSSSQNISCPGMNNGIAAVNVTGGIPPYIYEWGPIGATDSIISGLPAGSYTIKVEDANGCFEKDMVTVASPSQLALITSSTDANCFGENSGSASAIVTGGTLPYSYFWSNGNTTPEALYLQAGTYTVNITDHNSCTINQTIIVSQPQPVEVSVNAPSSICIGSHVLLNADASGGTGGYTYAWSTTETTSTINVAPSVTTQYSVTAYDSKGCSSSPNLITVPVYPPVSGSISISDTVCDGDTLFVHALASGGNGGPYYYSWPGGQSGPTYSAIAHSNTVVTVTINDGCTVQQFSTSATLPVKPAPLVNFSMENAEGCQPLTVLFADHTNENGSHYWNFGDGSSDTSKNPVHTFLHPGTFTVNHLVTSAEGCTGRIISPSSVNVYAVPEADFTNVPEEASILNPVISFFDASINAREWTWDFGDHSEMAHSKNTEHIFSDTGYYSVKMIATSHTGCADTVRKTVLIKGEFAVYIPNAFTPNNDGTNDKFSALGIGISDYEMLIYNRWGEKIYETKSLSDGWNGIRMDRDEKCAADVYVYKIYVVDNMGRRHDYVGHVNLVR